MTLVIADRVRETSTSTGTSTFVLAGAVVGYQSFFSAIGNANTTYYTISNQGTSEWEVGIGTISTGSLTRTTVLASSNAGALVNFSAGTKDVFGTYPAEKAVYLDASGNVSLSGTFSGTISGTGAFTTLSASSTVSGTGFSTYLASPPAIGGTAAASGAFTTLSASSTTTLSGGVANGVAYLNGSKVLTTGSALTFDGTNFGVGTSSPSYKLDVAGNSRLGDGNNGILYLNGGATSYANIQFQYAGTTKGMVRNDGASGGLVFSGSGTTEEMRLTSTGLGIGTSSPSSAVDVVKPLFIGGPLVGARYNTSNLRIGFGIGNNNGFPFLGVNVNNAANDNGTFDINNWAARIRMDNGTFQFQGSSASGTAGSAITWNTNATLDSFGNLGLGVTPSVWLAGYRAFEMPQVSLFSGAGGGGYLYGNAYLNASGNPIYKVSGQAATALNFQGGGYTFGIAPSGTAGNPISFTQAMTLDASGYLTLNSASATLAFKDFSMQIYRNTNDMVFYTGSSERARIDSSGNFLVGVTSASYSSANRGVINIGGSSSALLALISGSNKSYMLQSGVDCLIENDTTTGSIVFGTNASTERMRIDSSGNLGLGVTPNAWSNVVIGLQVRNASLGGTTSQAFLSQGTYYNAGWKHIGTGSRVGQYYIDDNGQHIWFTAPAGSAGTGVALAQVMTLDASGNLLVGDTTSGGRLRVKSADASSSAYGLFILDSAGNLMIGTRNDGYLRSPIVYNQTSSAGANITVDSNGYIYRSTSSTRYKNSITDAVHGLAEVLKLRPVTYKGNNDGDTVFGGLIAEEVHDAGLTEFVQYNDDGEPDALHYGNMVSLAFKAIQELKAELDQLKSQIGK